MAVLFVSHSSRDDAAADVLEAWLRANGFTDIFVDHQSLAAGDKWRQELRTSAAVCRVVVCLVTENWLASDECFGEFVAANYIMGKRIIPLFLLAPIPNLGEAAKSRLAKVSAEDQGINLNSCIATNGVLDFEADPNVAARLRIGLRAAGALNRVGLDPEAFAIDRKLRPTPFPGLDSFADDDADAALFYGRSREIAETLEALRQMRAAAERRPFVIFGSSGAGKSSLLKAGIIPRLRREAPAWLPLRAFRPGAAPLLNFAEAIARTLADFGKIEAHGVICDRLLDAWTRAERDRNGLTSTGREALEAAVEAEGKMLRAAAGRNGASILISIDQAEEMARAEGDSSDALADYLRAALASSSANWQLAFTIRTDSFPELQSHRRFQDLKARGYDLRAIPMFRFESVVEEPAKRYGVEIEHRLVNALMEDAPHEDALPLLAFALQRLWRQFASSGALTKMNYDKLGGLKLLIEDAAERALRGLAPDEDVPLPAGPPTKRRIDLAASTFVPALAQINEQGANIRRVAPWASFSEEQQELLLEFEHWRLVVRKGVTGTVEVAHEALFREWTRLQGWLEPERARLEALRSLQIDASNWDRNGGDAAFLSHRGKRLAVGAALARIEGYRKRMNNVELDYLAACRKRMWRMRALVGALALGGIAGVVGWLNEAYVGERINWFATMRPYMLANIRPFVLTQDAERALKRGDTFKECVTPKDCPTMVVVPAGEFLMGSPEKEKDRGTNEGPQHKVAIAKAFAVAKFDVTFENWDACVSVGGCAPALDEGFGRGTRPVINVTWDDAKKYASWLSTMTGKEYRLLSEAEWEYAARGRTEITGVSFRFSFGDDEAALGEYAWYLPNSEHKTHPVGEKRPNAFGLFDMEGNVFEWVEDCANSNYDDAPTDGSAWMSDDCTGHFIRGGSWLQPSPLLRSAYRDWLAPRYRSSRLGFRVGRTLDR